MISYYLSYITVISCRDLYASYIVESLRQWLYLETVWWKCWWLGPFSIVVLRLDFLLNAYLQKFQYLNVKWECVLTNAYSQYMIPYAYSNSMCHQGSWAWIELITLSPSNFRVSLVIEDAYCLWEIRFWFVIEDAYYLWNIF